MVDEGPPAGEARPSSAGSKQTGSSQITKPGRSMVTRQAARVKRWCRYTLQEPGRHY